MYHAFDVIFYLHIIIIIIIIYYAHYITPVSKLNWPGRGVLRLLWAWG